MGIWILGVDTALDVLTGRAFSLRGQPAGRHRERPDAAGPQRPGEGLPPHQQEAHSADGRPGGTQCPSDHIRCVTNSLHCNSIFYKAFTAIGKTSIYEQVKVKNEGLTVSLT